MSSILHLPVSIGEAIDKLTILEIKYEKIQDQRKNDVKLEFDMLFEKLKDIVQQHPLFYKMMKQVNLDIWDMMDILRDHKVDDQLYLEKCKECIEWNDIRFRVKNKINSVSHSTLKEQKGYKTTRVLFDISSLPLLYDFILPPIKYYSFLYDETHIICSPVEYDFLKSHFAYDPTIHISSSPNHHYSYEFQKTFHITSDSQNDLYQLLNITDDLIQKYYIA